VLGKRSDGFHELESLMVTVGLYDTLRFTSNSSGILQLHCRFAGLRDGASEQSAETLPVDFDNLVLKAARLLRDATGCTQGANIELWKRIPLAAGLAGGSSDAAATLWGLDRLWNLNSPPRLLHEPAAQLGSDIPFFLSCSSAAICRGRGEIITPVAVPAGLQFVIARPATGLSTAEVYRQCRPETSVPGANALVRALARGLLHEAGTKLHNTLQTVALELNADVRRLRRMFARLPFTGHLMSGSGTSYFGLCRNRREAQHLAARLRAAGAGRVFVAATRP
ncbi:MAG: 4-(cytidine 5'-diphospho)-2-C-methyl-D-erythritol kinase, partial [Planctomycetaceae bacterium]